MLDSPESVCAGQMGFEYPATSVPFSNLGVYGQTRPGKTAFRTAVPCTLLIRMRSQVQVLAGPPAIVAGQSAVGSKPGTLAASLGRAGAARPSPPASPSAPSGPVNAGGGRHDHHAGWSPHPSRGRQPPGRCGNLALRPLAVPSRSRRRRALGTPAWPAQEASVKRGRRPHPTRPGFATDSPPTLRRLGGVARVRGGSAVDRAARRRGSPQGPGPRSRGGGCRAASACPQPPPPDGGPGGRVRTDGWTPTGWTPDRWTPDGRTPDPGRRTQVTGHRTGWTAGSRTTEPDRWTPPAGRGPATDAMAGVLAWSSTATVPACWIPAGRSAGQTHLGEQLTRTAQQQGLRGGSRS
jgi:hypothetical protein